jgi:hypothetical protein
LQPQARKKMKREEEALLKLTLKNFNSALLHRKKHRSAAA